MLDWNLMFVYIVNSYSIIDEQTNNTNASLWWKFTKMLSNTNEMYIMCMLLVFETVSNRNLIISIHLKIDYDIYNTTQWKTFLKMKY